MHVAAERTPVSDYAMFYEVVDGALVRRMQALEVAHRTSGHGAVTVLALHSLSAASGAFARLAAALDGRARTCAADLRGFGGSHRPTKGYDVEVLAADAAKVAAACTPARPRVLLGHGLGACVGLEAARLAPFDGLALSGVALAAGQPAALAPLEELGQDRPEELPAALGGLTGSPTVGEDVTPQVVAQAVRAWRAFDGTSAAAQLDLPLLVLGGEDDALAPVDAEGGGKWLADRARGELVRLPGGHELPAEQPDALAAELRRWMDDHDLGKETDGRA